MSDQPPEKCLRRTLFKGCIGCMTLASAGMVGYPVVAFLGRPVRVGADKPVEVPLDQLAEGQAEYAQWHGQQIIILATSQGHKVYNASCPHLGCNVIWDTAKAMFHCPCHGAQFDDSGKVVSGPVSSPLKEIPFEIKDGKLIVT